MRSFLLGRDTNGSGEAVDKGSVTVCVCVCVCGGGGGAGGKRE
jgi:hypothetical protein